MGIVNQSWRDTMALLGRQIGITPDELKAGWPSTFRVDRIAVLQRPFKWWPVKDREPEKAALCRAYKDGLSAAMDSGELIHTTETSQGVIGHDSKFQGFDYSHRNAHGERVAKPHYSSVPKYGDKEVVTITAQAFAAWLTAQREMPSVHIQAWFDAVGVAGAAHPEPGMDSAPVVDAGAPKEALFDSAPEKKKRKPRVTWKTEIPYIAEVYACTTQSGAKGLWRELKAKAGTVGSPFILGQGTDREKLLVKESHASLAEHTLETNMMLVRAEAERLPKKHK